MEHEKKLMSMIKPMFKGVRTVNYFHTGQRRKYCSYYMADSLSSNVPILWDVLDFNLCR
jgi:hypothetical protein